MCNIVIPTVSSLKMLKEQKKTLNTQGYLINPKKGRRKDHKS